MLLNCLRVKHAITCTAITLSALFAAAPTGAQAQTVSTILSFPSADSEPLGVIAQGRDGNYYGVTASGAIYNVTASGTFTLLHTLVSGEGQQCNGLVLGTDGNFYGTCYAGGADGFGSFIKVTPAGTLTVLHSFAGGTTDGCDPLGSPLQASDGNFYGTTVVCGINNTGIAYKMTPAGVETVIHAFVYNTESSQPRGTLIQGSDGNLWGTTSWPSGAIFKMTTAGVSTAIYQFGASGCGIGSPGCSPQAGLVQGTDGNYYGVAPSGGANSQGVVFKVTPGGVYTVLHSFNETTDTGGYPSLPLTLGTDGNFYGIASGCAGGGCSAADIFEITPKGVFTNLYSFPNAGNNNNSLPFTPLLLGTDGTFYATTEQDGSGTGSNSGTFYSLVDGQNPFVAPIVSSGKVGSQIGILGQGFTSSSVVKFNGVAATTVTRTGSTYLTATVPAGASSGFITVTTGTTTLSSRRTFVVHNSWGSGKAIPTAVAGAASGFIGTKIYVVSGFTTQGAAPVSNTQIYTPTTNTWTTGAAIPTPVAGSASAVVSGLLYVIGGYEGASATPSNLVQIYNPAKNTWTTGTSMPTARGSVAAVVDANAIYVIGGNGSTLRLNTVEKYVPSTNTWTEEAPLLTGKSEPAAGLLGTTIVAPDGYTTSGDTGDNEGYNVSTNTWSSLTSDPTPRNASCYGVSLGQLYVAGGINTSNPQTTVTVNESFSASTKKWTTQAPMPSAALWQASAVDSGVLYCIGGQSSFQGSTINNVQIYQP